MCRITVNERLKFTRPSKEPCGSDERCHIRMMAPRSDAPVRAILGPTNTGKTHLAIERMCGHSSGVIGFPLRLLAREVYERVVAIKGEKQVALLTGEERIVPPQARYVLATAESMPVRTGIDSAVHRT